MSELKDKTVSGLSWSFIENFASLGITFLVGIILARVLTPREFGLIGMIIIFIALSQSFIDSGFTQALIRKNNCTQADYSTVFYFNLAASILFFIIIYVLAGPISSFFNEPELIHILRIMGIGIVINATAIVQRAKLVKRIDFKLLTKVSVTAAILSGIVGIGMAYNGFGVWSLVWRMLTGYFITSLLLWIWNKWNPSFVFSKKSFKEMFSFGSKLLMSGLIDTTYRNIYLLIIGKFFSAADLGFYTRADQFKKLPSENLTAIIQRVSYPVLASIQDDIPTLKAAYKKLIRSTMLITFVLMLGLAAVARPLVITLIGAKWEPSVIYLQLLCFVGMLYPLQALNLNMLKVEGRSDLYLKLEIIKKIFAIPIIVIGIFYGIKAMIVGMIVNTFISYYLNSYWSGKLIGYSAAEQIKDILPSFLLAVIIGITIWGFGYFIHLQEFWQLVAQILLGAILFLLISEILKMNDYLYLKNIALEKLTNKN